MTCMDGASSPVVAHSVDQPVDNSSTTWALWAGHRSGRPPDAGGCAQSAATIPRSDTASELLASSWPPTRPSPDRLAACRTGNPLSPGPMPPG